MAVVFHKEINETSSWLLWEIEEELGSYFMEVDLNLEERDYFDSITNHYKKLEWLATRAAMRELLAAKGLQYKGILKDSHGKPHLQNQEGHISVSHSFPWVAVIYHKSLPVGIDLEKPRDKIVRVAHKFLNDSELEYSRENVRMITLLWSAKETLYKVHGRKFVVFKENLEIEPFGADQSVFNGQIKVNGHVERFQLNYEENDDFLVTYTAR